MTILPTHNDIWSGMANTSPMVMPSHEEISNKLYESKVGKKYLSYSGIVNPDDLEIQSAYKEASSKINHSNLLDSIKYLETRGKKNQYSFFQPSSKKNSFGDALGAYQVTEAELRERSKQFMDRDINREEFLSNPKLQDEFMLNKTLFLQSQGFKPEDILASHRGGFSDRSEIAKAKRLQERKQYVKEGMQQFNNSQLKDIVIQ